MNCKLTQKPSSRRLGIILVIVTSVIGGCVTSTSPHENYLSSMLRSSIGRDIRRDTDFNKYENRVLQNGNVEYRRTDKFRVGTCVSIYEVDPSSYVVLRADFVGTQSSCAINP